MLPHLLGWVSSAFLLAGIIVGGYAGYNYFLVHAYQSMETHRFEHRAPLVEPHLPVIGEAIGQIQVRRLKLKAVIVQGASEDVLRLGVGHLPETALPGEWGNVAIAGHRDRLFRPLREIRQGDIITIETSSKLFQYEVESTLVVAPTEVEVLRSTDRHELTLITCYPFEYIGSAPNRFVVRAREVTPAGK